MYLTDYFLTTKEDKEYLTEFFTGKDTTNSYFGRLFLTFREHFLPLVMENYPYFKILLSNKHIQEKLSPNVNRFKELIFFIDKLNKTWRKFRIELPSRVSRIIQQFLNYFSEFVEKAKGHKISFNITRVGKYLEIEIFGTEESDINRISIYLKEYFSLLNQDENALSIQVEYKMETTDFNLMILDLKQQINHFKQSFEIEKMRNQLLQDKVIYLKQITKKVQKILSNPNIDTLQVNLNEKDIFLKLLANNEVKSCIDGLLKHFKTNGNKKIIEEIIIQSSKFNRMNESSRYGILNDDELEIRQNKIVKSLIEITTKNI